MCVISSLFFFNAEGSTEISAEGAEVGEAPTPPEFWEREGFPRLCVLCGYLCSAFRASALKKNGHVITLRWLRSRPLELSSGLDDVGDSDAYVIESARLHVGRFVLVAAVEESDALHLVFDRFEID